MALEQDHLYGVTILPPDVGAAPSPADTLAPALELLAVIHGGPRSLGDRVSSGLKRALMETMAALVNVTYRPQAHGLSASETQAWAEHVCGLLTPDARRALIDYAQTCAEWYRRLRTTTGDDAADPDWDMTSAKNVAASAPEAYLAQTLAEVGIPVQAQVGVSQRGGARKGGWFASYWLDCAHRDVAYRLRIDIELDGATHYHRERQAKDAMRNQALQERGWYIVRLSGRILGQRNHHLALERIVALVERHRRAVVLARSDMRMLETVLSAPDAESQKRKRTIEPLEGASPAQIAASPDLSLREHDGARPIAAETLVCPRCGSHLVLRQARQGPRAGSQFYGCSTYPRCRHSQAAS